MYVMRLFPCTAYVIYEIKIAILDSVQWITFLIHWLCVCSIILNVRPQIIIGCGSTFDTGYRYSQALNSSANGPKNGRHCYMSVLTVFMAKWTAWNFNNGKNANCKTYYLVLAFLHSMRPANTPKKKVCRTTRNSKNRHGP